MDIHMTVIDKDSQNSSSFDEVDIRESGQSIGEAIADAIDEELSYPKTRSITITINL